MENNSTFHVGTNSTFQIADLGSQDFWNNDYCWRIALVLATGVLLGRRGFVHYAEQGRSAAQVFALRARSLTYITGWALFMIGTLVLACMAEPEEAIGVAALFVAELVAVSLWRDYFANGDFIPQYVKEAKARLTYLLTHGLAMHVTQFEEFWRKVECELVEFWRKNLENKKWSDLSEEQRGKLLFDSGVEIAKMMTRELWEGVLFDVAAFMREWLSDIESVKVPERIKKKMQDGGDAEAQTLFCVGIMVANETRELRRASREKRKMHSGQEFSAARIARRKTAAEGILHWPNCLSRVDEIEILGGIKWNTEALYILTKGGRQPCSESSIPFSVWYSLIQIIKAGYLRVSPEKTISAEVTFKYSNMVFKKDEWNPQRTIERRPFRFITSATWMSGDPAFMVAQREVAGDAAEFDGSGCLEGVLRLELEVDVKQQRATWLQEADFQSLEDKIWGNIGDFIKEKHPRFFNLPMLWTIKMAWVVFGFFSSLHKYFVREPAHDAEDSDSDTISRTNSDEQRTVQRLLSNDLSRALRDHVSREEEIDLRRQYSSYAIRTISVPVSSSIDEGPSSSAPSDPENSV